MNLSQNSRMEMNREYVSNVDTDTHSDAELDYKAKKCALRAWKCRSAGIGSESNIGHDAK